MNGWPKDVPTSILRFYEEGGRTESAGTGARRHSQGVGRSAGAAQCDGNLRPGECGRRTGPALFDPVVPFSQHSPPVCERSARALSTLHANELVPATPLLRPRSPVELPSISVVPPCSMQRRFAGWTSNPGAQCTRWSPIRPTGSTSTARHSSASSASGAEGYWRLPPSFDGHRRSPLPRFTTLTPGPACGISRRSSTSGARRLRPRLVPGAHVFVASSPLLSFIVAGALARAGLERRGEIIRLTTTMRGGDRPQGRPRRVSRSERDATLELGAVASLSRTDRRTGAGQSSEVEDWGLFAGRARTSRSET